MQMLRKHLLPSILILLLLYLMLRPTRHSLKAMRRKPKT